jgi:hypothetical protein
MRYLLFSEVGDDYVFRRMIKRVPIFFSLCLLISHAPRLCASQMPAANEVVRHDFAVSTEPRIRIFVREVRRRRPVAREGVPILLIHRARPSGVAWFDLNVPGGSLAADLAAAGHTAYIPDMRGFGRSTRPAAMNEPPERNTPSVRSPEVVRDIQDFVEWISKREHLQRIAILGLGNRGALGRIFRNTLPRTHQPLNSMQHVVWCLDRLATPEGNARSGRSNQAQEN